MAMGLSIARSAAGIASTRPKDSLGSDWFQLDSSSTFGLAESSIGGATALVSHSGNLIASSFTSTKENANVHDELSCRYL